MPILYIASTVLVSVALTLIVSKRKRTIYQTIKDQLKHDIVYNQFTGNWVKVQELNTQLIWLKTVSESGRTSDMQFTKGGEAAFPKVWSLNNLDHFILASKIVGTFGEMIADKDSQNFHNPISVLPFPIKYINKSFYYLYDYSRSENANLMPENLSYEALEACHFVLNQHYYNPGYSTIIAQKQDLTRPEQIAANITLSKYYSNKTKTWTIKDEIQCIDWKDEAYWINRGEQYLSEGKHELSKLCIEKALIFNPNSGEVFTLIDKIKE